MQFLSAAWQGGSHNIPQHHPTSPNNCLNSGFLEALSASNGKCHFEGQRDSSSSLSSVARMCLWWQGLQHLVTASGRYSHPFIPHLLQDCYKSQKKTANLFPGSHLTSSRHQLICDQHGKSSEIKAKVPTWWGDGHPNIFFWGGGGWYTWYTLRLEGGVDMFCWDIMRVLTHTDQKCTSCALQCPCMRPCTSNSLQSKGPTLI